MNAKSQKANAGAAGGHAIVSVVPAPGVCYTDIRRRPRVWNGLEHAGEGGEPLNPLLERISVDPAVCFGKPCIRGTRIWVSLLLDLLANGMSVEEILAEYPALTGDDIRAALAYGAEMARERYVNLPDVEAGRIRIHQRAGGDL